MAKGGGGAGGGGSGGGAASKTGGAVQSQSDFNKALSTAFEKADNLNTGVVPLYKLREALNLSEQKFNDYVLKLQESGNFRLERGQPRRERPDFQKIIDASIKDPDRGSLNYLSKTD